MLSFIEIENFCIIESSRVELNAGFQVFSGETGAGKSFLLQAIQFALGAKASTQLIRSGAQQAVVHLGFERVSKDLLEALKEKGLSLDPQGRVEIRRSLDASGKSQLYLQGKPCTIKEIQKYAASLLHLVGQGAVRALFEEEFLIDYLDRMGGKLELRARYQEAFECYEKSKRVYQELKKYFQDLSEKEEVYRFQLEELNQAKLVEGEVAELETKQQRVKHQAVLVGLGQNLMNSLQDGSPSLNELFSPSLQVFQKMESLDASLNPLAESFRESVENIRDLSGRLQSYLEDLLDSRELYESLASRLYQLKELQRKYRCDEAGLLALRQRLEEQLLQIEDQGPLLQRKQQELETAKAELVELAGQLGGERKITAAKMKGLMLKSLKDLSLPHVEMEWNFVPLASVEQFKSHGGEELRLMVSFNPGEPKRLLQEVVSGGESSRFLLALYEILFSRHGVGTLIFDEVDVGVGGKVAEQVGKKIKALSQHAQVLCITHLPQIACQADRHFLVEKQVRQGRTYSNIVRLDESERVEEIARMLAGWEVTPQARQHARSLMESQVA